MIRRLYVHNYRCLENFVLPIAGQSSVLLIGRNAAGKSVVGFALEIFQRVARGSNRVPDLLQPKDFAQGRTDIPIRFEIEVSLAGSVFACVLAFELPAGGGDVRVREERLSVDGRDIYTRDRSEVHLPGMNHGSEATFSIDPLLVALPILQPRSGNDPLFTIRNWLARMLVFRPVPSLICGQSDHETLYPDAAVTNLAAWFSGLIAAAPAAYARIDGYLRQMFPDLQEIQNPRVGRSTRSLMVRFSGQGRDLSLALEDLSDGEKCLLIGALVLAANQTCGPLLCFWDEPDNYLAPSEVGHFILSLRKALRDGSQFIATSHNEETIRSFSEENTLILSRASHLEPAIVRRLDELDISGDLVDAFTRGDLHP